MFCDRINRYVYRYLKKMQDQHLTDLRPAY